MKPGLEKTSPTRAEPHAAERLNERLLAHFLLLEDPFSLAPDPAFLYLSEGHVNALATLEIGVTERQGPVVLTGPAGTGKTTLARHIIETSSPDARVLLHADPRFSFEQFLRQSLSGLGIAAPTDDGRELREAFDRALRRARRRGHLVSLVFDEAQSLDLGVLEGLGELVDRSSEDENQVQVVLIGQPDLEHRLAHPRARRLHDRVHLRGALGPLAEAESEEYILHRLDKAGGVPELFDSRARRLIVEASAGIPRRLNVLCYDALLFAFGRSEATVDESSAKAAVRQWHGSARERPGLSDRIMRVPTPLLLAVLLLITTVAVLVVSRRPGAPTEPGPIPVSNVRPGEPAGSAETARAEAPPPSQEASSVPPSSTPDPRAASEAGTLDDGVLVLSSPSGQPVDVVWRRSQEGDLEVDIVSGVTLYELLVRIYRGYDAALLTAVSNANPLLRDPDRLSVGQRLFLPCPAAGRSCLDPRTLSRSDSALSAQSPLPPEGL